MSAFCIYIAEWQEMVGNFYSLRVNTPRLAAKEIVGFYSEYPAACGGVIYLMKFD